MSVLILSSGLESMLYTAAGYVLAFGIGFGLKQAQLRKSRKRVLELEEGMLKDHATILKLEQQISLLEENMEDENIGFRKMMA